MNFSVDPHIFEKFPGVAIGVLIISDMVNSRKVEEITSLLRKEEIRQKEILPQAELGSLPEIAIWRTVYKQFGSNPHDFRSSVEALLRRAKTGKPLPEINPLVDCYNYISLKYHLPVGAEDLDAIQGDIALTFANGSESGVALGYEKEESPDPGEVIYKDDVGFICRKWNWREADRTKIRPETTSAVFVIEKAPIVERAILDSALVEAKALVTSYLQAKCEIMVLEGNQ